MEPFVNALPGVTGIIVSVATLVLTQIRTQKTDDRAASKDSFDMLSKLNEAQAREIDDMRDRVKLLENEHAECQKERAELLKRLAGA